MKRSIFPLLFLVAAIFSAATAHAAILQVGPGKPFAAPCAAILKAVSGDTIQIDSSVTYVGDVCSWLTPNLTIVGVGGARAHIDAGGQNSQGKAIWVISGANTTIENVEFSGATVPDNNGAGIRQQADNLTLRNCYFHDNQEGILTDASLTSTITIEFSEFAFNGFGDGQTHNVYIGNIGTLIFRYNYSHHAIIGHLLKTRAANNIIIGNRLSDKATGTSSYQIDIPNGGLSYVIGNVLEQGPLNDNSTFIAYMEEGINAGNPNHQLFVINNTFANDTANATFVAPNLTSALPVVIKNNIFYGPGTLTAQASAIKANNLITNTNPGFVNLAGYDYHLLSTSPAINAGADPGSDGTFGSLTPAFQYVHPACAEGRVSVGVIDIGAYEFGGGTGIAPPNGTCSTATGPLMILSGSSLTFGTQPIGSASAAQHVTINNGGNATMNLSSIVASGDFSQTNDCGATLAAGVSCTVNVTFKPTASGTRTGAITITDSAAGSPHTVNLTGTGSNAAVDFTLSSSPASATVTAGRSATYTVSIGASGGFSQAVALSCSGAPAGVTCTATPASANPNGGTVTAQITVKSTARAGLFQLPSVRNFPMPPVWAVVLLASLVMFVWSLKKERKTRLAFALPALALLAASLGCGSTGNLSASNGNGNGTTGTPAGTYSLTVTGTAGTTTHSTTIKLIVN